MNQTQTHDTPIDRENRDRLAKAMEDLLHQRLAGETFDDIREEIASETCDATVQFVCSELWGFDDSGEEMVEFYREDWNRLHRLLLLLRSDGHVALDRRWKCSFIQFFAAPLLMIHAVLWWFFGTGALAISLPFSLVLTPIAFWLLARRFEMSPRLEAMSPFSSITELLQARRSVPDFWKPPFKRSESPEPIV